MGTTSDRDERIEELIVKTEILLHSLETAGDLTSGAAVEPAALSAQEKRPDELTALERRLGLKTDGYVEVLLSDDEMTASAYFYPPSEHGGLIEPESVERVLRDSGVVQGVDWDRIKESIFTCNTERVEILDVPVARGRQPRDEIPEHFRIEERLLQARSQVDQRALSVDYKEVSPFVLVTQDEVIARVLPKAAGVMGHTVTGKAVAYRVQKVGELKAGDNTYADGDLVKAKCPGRFRFDGRTFWIDKVLEIFSDIDYSTGHIGFDGDVIIHGEVKDGFKVQTGGSLVCDKTLEASEVYCAGDLFIKYGIIGKNRGTVKAGGRLEARFIENCTVEAKGPVAIQVGILNSSIYTLDQVSTSERGMIVGGKILARNGVKAAQIGTPASPKTEIYCGLDFYVLRKLEWIRDKNVELALKLRNVERGLQSHPDQRDRLEETRTRIKEAIGRLNEAAKGLISQLHQNEAAEVAVLGTVFPGTFIEICHVPFIVSSRLRKVRFVLDKAQGKIVIRAY